jgi:hypothetical protein
MVKCQVSCGRPAKHPLLLWWGFPFVNNFFEALAVCLPLSPYVFRCREIFPRIIFLLKSIAKNQFNGFRFLIREMKVSALAMFQNNAGLLQSPTNTGSDGSFLRCYILKFTLKKWGSRMEAPLFRIARFTVVMACSYFSTCASLAHSEVRKFFVVGLSVWWATNSVKKEGRHECESMGGGAN